MLQSVVSGADMDTAYGRHIHPQTEQKIINHLKVSIYYPLYEYNTALIKCVSYNYISSPSVLYLLRNYISLSLYKHSYGLDRLLGDLYTRIHARL